MARNSRRKLGLAASVAGLMAAGPALIHDALAAERAGAERLKQQDDGCPQAASAAGALKTIAAAQTDYNRSQGRKKTTKKKAAKRKTTRKASGLKVEKTAVKRLRTRKKAAKKTAARRNPC